MATDTVPVIVCDFCGSATPARLGASLGKPPVTEKERAAELAELGWQLSPERDLCPHCVAHGLGKA